MCNLGHNVNDGRKLRYQTDSPVMGSFIAINNTYKSYD